MPLISAVLRRRTSSFVTRSDKKSTQYQSGTGRQFVDFTQPFPVYAGVTRAKLSGGSVAPSPQLPRREASSVKSRVEPTARVPQVSVYDLPQPESANVSFSGSGVHETVQHPDTKKRTIDPESFFGCTSLEELANLESPVHVAEVCMTLAATGRKPSSLFRVYKSRLMNNPDAWNLSALSTILNAWTNLEYIREDVCLRVAPRCVDLMPTASPRELANIYDAYATSRLWYEPLHVSVVKRARETLEHFSPSELASVLSSLAKFGRFDRDLVSEAEQKVMKFHETSLSAKDCCLFVYSFARAQSLNYGVFEKLSARVSTCLHNLTATELGLLSLSHYRSGFYSSDLLSKLVSEAVRRIGQFDASSLAILLKCALLTTRSFCEKSTQASPSAFLSIFGGNAVSRITMQLPRLGSSFVPIDVVVYLNIFALFSELSKRENVNLSSNAAALYLADLAYEKCAFFKSTDWESVLTDFATLGLDGSRLSEARLRFSDKAMTGILQNYY